MWYVPCIAWLSGFLIGLAIGAWLLGGTTVINFPSPVVP